MRAALLVLVLSGCNFMRSSNSPLRTAALVDERSECVLVMLPGLGDDPSLFEQHGFHTAVSASDSPCDVVTVDAHFGYYRDAVLPQRLANEVLQPLRAQYRKTWLVGVSLGGYGAALTAKEKPELVDGVVLISPFLGVPRGARPLVERIKSAGGLASFRTEVTELTKPQRHFVEVEPLWGWLGSRARGEAGPELMFAFGEADGFAWKHQVLSDALSAEAQFREVGGHDWRTFAQLWRKVVVAAPWRSQ